MVRITSLYGKGPMAGWVAQARAVIAERGWAQTAEARSELLIESLSRTVGADLSCLFDRWRWPMSWQLRQRLSAYGPNPICADADFDGFSRAAYTSADGAAWSQLGASVTLALSAKVHAGLAVTSHDNTALVTAGFGNAVVKAYTPMPGPRPGS